MVFFNRMLKKLKLNVPSELFTKWTKKVEKNTQDIQTTKDNINLVNENINTVNAEIDDIKENVAYKNRDNTFTGNCNFTHDNIKVGRIIYGGRDDDGDTWLLPRQTTGKRTLRIGNSTKNDNQRFDLNMENRSYITNLPTPTANQHAANKQYVDTGLNTKLNITDAQSEYARMTSGIQNDFQSDNIFRKTPQVMGAITEPNHVITKQYFETHGTGGGGANIRTVKLSELITIPDKIQFSRLGNDGKFGVWTAALGNGDKKISEETYNRYFGNGKLVGYKSILKVYNGDEHEQTRYGGAFEAINGVFLIQWIIPLQCTCYFMRQKDSGTEEDGFAIMLISSENYDGIAKSDDETKSNDYILNGKVQGLGSWSRHEFDMEFYVAD